MNKNKGICYGVSVGPSDPELMTLKAAKIISEADVIFLPSAPKENCKVYKIIKGSELNIEEEKFVCIETASMADPKVQSDRYDKLAGEVAKLLDEGKSVAFPALGEVCLYSTYFYVHERLVSEGYECKLISGISSVQEAADRLLMSLAQGDEELHIFPDTENIDEKLKIPYTKVFMKPKSDIKDIAYKIKEFTITHPGTKAYGISNIGAENEIIAHSIEELSNLQGYMTVIIVK
ncbi:MAG: precorrin-2 C(20)-methyltransferase [Lachnospiraceae bacterium]|nr:precorrin-2 C(20)-methyltransferase [Lachnospiraceae bacterium]